MLRILTFLFAGFASITLISGCNIDDMHPIELVINILILVPVLIFLSPLVLVVCVWLLMALVGFISSIFSNEKPESRQPSSWEDRHSNDPCLKGFRRFVKDLEKEEWWRNRQR